MIGQITKLPQKFCEGGRAIIKQNSNNNSNNFVSNVDKVVEKMIGQFLGIHLLSKKDQKVTIRPVGRRRRR